ncbi:MAG: ATPase [Anaerolineae bacterium]|nr:ATPase [Anaerolineae bacterium]
MAKYFLGVDIGGTKSHALIADETGRALGLGVGGAGNHEVVGYQGLVETLNAITNEALSMAGISKNQLAGAGFGIAGYDWPAEREPTRQAIQTLGLSAPLAFANDTIIGLLAGAAEGWGVAVVAGTGTNCRGRDREGREGRIIGAGSWSGEYGGASELVDKAVQAVALAWTQRGPTTRLTEAFIDLTGATDVMDLLEGLALERYRLSAAAAPIVFQVAAEGDEVAQEIIHWAGHELGSLAIGVIRQLGFEQLDFEVILIGSLFKGSPTLIETMSATIHAVAPKARLVRLAAPPVVGGVLLGMEQAGVEYSSIRQTLIDTTNAMLDKS